MPDFIFSFVVRFGRCNVREVFFECSNVWIDGHAVVIQNDEHVGVLRSAVIQSFEG